MTKMHKENEFQPLFALALILRSIVLVCLNFLSMGTAAYALVLNNRIVVVGSKFCPLQHGSTMLFLLVPMVQWHHVHR